MKTSVLTILLSASLVVALLVGWGKCIYKFASCDFKPSYKAEIIYGAGVFLGYGAVIGYFDIGK